MQKWVRTHRWHAAGAAVLLVLLGALYLVFSSGRDPRIVFGNLSKEHGQVLTAFLETRDTPLTGNHEVLSWETIQHEGEPSGLDLFVGLWGTGPTETPRDLVPLPRESLSLLPSSLRRIGRIEGEQRALPIALDHVELLYRHDFYAEAGALVEGRVRELEGLEEVASQYVGSGFYPIVVAGGEDRALLDLVSVLTLSLGGVEAYRGLLEELQALELTEDDSPFAAVTAEGWEFSQVEQRLRQWREAKLIHPEWTVFTEDDTFRFLESQRTVAVVMRLSTHRSWPPYALHRWRSSPFPYSDPRLAGTGLIVPAYVAAVPADSPWREEAVATAPMLQAQPFQEQVVQAWRLAPVHSIAEALDRESADLRFWAAASRDVLPAFSDALSAEQAGTLAEAIRRELAR